MGNLQLLFLKTLLNSVQVADLLRRKADEYNQVSFIDTDPIQIPHRFSKQSDIEIAGFLSAIIAWGQRGTIIKNATTLLGHMDNSPYEFVMGFAEKDLLGISRFVHRTFNGDDCLSFMHGLRRVYRDHGGLEQLIRKSFAEEPKFPGRGWSLFKSSFFDGEHLARSQKHLPNPTTGSAAKRMNMYMRWMVRKDNQGVDFGIWNSFNPAELYIPLDVHTARVARKLGILERKQDDWKAVLELTERLRLIEPEDPIKLDFALFGLGAFEKF